MRLLSHYIGREFRKAIGHDLPYSFVLEHAPDEHRRLHLHGVVVPGAADLDQVRRALIRAGGKIEGRRYALDQLDLQPIKEATGWTLYCTKMKRWGKVVPVGRYTFTSNPLKQSARLYYDERGLTRDVSFCKRRVSKKK